MERDGVIYEKKRLEEYSFDPSNPVKINVILKEN